MFKKIVTFLIIFLIIGYSSLIFCAGLNTRDSRYPLREYRKFILPNQMKVILISDPTLKTAAASMTVAVGSMHDPLDNQGLAHLLEHMLFLGTKKFPKAGSYQKFISINNGFTNAYTTEDRTNYHFYIDSNYLEEALERFVQFFLSPIFGREHLKREIKVIEEEHSKNIYNDQRRIFQVKRKAFINGHPARHFATGNLDTLKSVTKEKLISFYKKYYSSNQMMLAVAGPQSMNYLQDLVVNRFSKVKNFNVKEKIVSSKFMKKDPRFRILQIKTIKDIRNLKLFFPLTKTLHHYKSRPLNMLGFLIGHEGNGSLLSLLKKENLASSLYAGVGISNKSFSSFDVDIQLTRKGFKNYKKVIKYFFQYINLIRKTGLPKYIFDEIKSMSEIEFKFAEKLEGTELVNTLSTLMMYYPMRKIEISPYLITDYKPRIFDSMLYNLTPENMLTILASRDADVDNKERFYSSDYSLKFLSPKFLKKWMETKPHQSLDLPLPNKFLPKRFKILDFEGKLKLTYQSILGLEKDKVSQIVIQQLKKYQGKTWDSLEKLLVGISPLPENESTLKKLIRKHALGTPQIIIENKLTKLWFQQDFRFKKPKGKLILRVNSPEVYSSSRNVVLTQLYIDSVMEELNEFGYQVRLAGLDFNISYDKKGIIIILGGFSDKILELTKSIAQHLKKVNISKKTFDRIKEIRSREYRNFFLQQPFKQAIYFRKILLEGRKFSIEEYEKELRGIKLSQLKEFGRKLYKKIYIEGMAYGNLNSRNLRKAIKEFSKKLESLPLEKKHRFTYTTRQISKGNDYTFIRKMDEDNSAVLIEYQVGQRDPKLLAEIMLINELLRPEFYNDLRTKQQLGYIVNSSISILGNTLGLNFLIQSNKKGSLTLKNRIDVFLGDFYFLLKNLTSLEIRKIKNSVLNKKLQKTNSIQGETSRLFTIAFERNANFDINSSELKSLEKVSHKDILEFYGKYLLPSNQRKLILRMISNKKKSENYLRENIISIPNFREKYFCPKNCLP